MDNTNAVTKLLPRDSDEEGPCEEADEFAQPGRVVYLQPQLSLVRVVSVEDDACVVLVSGRQARVAIDPSVDPQLLAEAARDGTRVVLETEGGTPVVVGALMARRPVTVDRDGRLHVRAQTIRLDAEDELRLKSSGAFLKLERDAVELFAERITQRARGAVRLLAGVIKLN